MNEPCTIIAGCKGMLGRELVTLAKTRPGRLLMVDVDELDITSKEDVDSFFSRERPDLVINTAAYTDVDGAETDLAADRVNHLGARTLAEACVVQGSLLVHFSTDYVFDGNSKTPYTVLASPSPINAYGRTKLAGELAIRASGAAHLIIRTSWLFAPHGINFLTTMLRLAQERDSLHVVDDQVGHPTYCPDLAAMTFQLIEAGARGTFHATNEGECSWFDFAEAIFDAAGHSMSLTPCSTEAFPRPASRPRYSVLDLSSTRQLIGPGREWREAVLECVSVLNES